MGEFAGAIVAGVAAVAVAFLTNFVALRQYKQNVSRQLRAESVQAILTEEQLQADFRREIRSELDRMRAEVDARTAAYHALEFENRELKKEVTRLEVEIMRLKAQLELHGIVTGAPAITGSPSETTAREIANGGQA